MSVMVWYWTTECGCKRAARIEQRQSSATIVCTAENKPVSIAAQVSCVAASVSGQPV